MIDVRCGASATSLWHVDRKVRLISYFDRSWQKIEVVDLQCFRVAAFFVCFPLCDGMMFALVSCVTGTSRRDLVSSKFTVSLNQPCVLELLHSP